MSVRSTLAFRARGGASPGRGRDAGVGRHRGPRAPLLLLGGAAVGAVRAGAGAGVGVNPCAPSPHGLAVDSLAAGSRRPTPLSLRRGQPAFRAVPRAKRVVFRAPPPRPVPPAAPELPCFDSPSPLPSPVYECPDADLFFAAAAAAAAGGERKEIAAAAGRAAADRLAVAGSAPGRRSCLSDKGLLKSAQFSAPPLADGTGGDGSGTGCDREFRKAGSAAGGRRFFLATWDAGAVAEQLKRIGKRPGTDPGISLVIEPAAARALFAENAALVPRHLPQPPAELQICVTFIGRSSDAEGGGPGGAPGAGGGRAVWAVRIGFAAGGAGEDGGATPGSRREFSMAMIGEKVATENADSAYEDVTLWAPAGRRSVVSRHACSAADSLLFLHSARAALVASLRRAGLAEKSALFVPDVAAADFPHFLKLAEAGRETLETYFLHCARSPGALPGAPPAGAPPAGAPPAGAARALAAARAALAELRDAAPENEAAPESFAAFYRHRPNAATVTEALWIVVRLAAMARSPRGEDELGEIFADFVARVGEFVAKHGGLREFDTDAALWEFATEKPGSLFVFTDEHDLFARIFACQKRSFYFGRGKTLDKSRPPLEGRGNMVWRRLCAAECLSFSPAFCEFQVAEGDKEALTRVAVAAGVLAGKRKSGGSSPKSGNFPSVPNSGLAAGARARSTASAAVRGSRRLPSLPETCRTAASTSSGQTKIAPDSRLL